LPFGTAKSFPQGLGGAPRFAGCRAGLRASSLAAALDFYSIRESVHEEGCRVKIPGWVKKGVIPTFQGSGVGGRWSVLLRIVDCGLQNSDWWLVEQETEMKDEILHSVQNDMLFG
jgi:hypothetical protein